jgi:trans-aconitate methyltransferase
LSDAFFRALAREASERYGRRDRFARHFAYGKLTRDPAFAHVLGAGLVTEGAPLLDLGCGQGLLGALIATANARVASGTWPADRARPPHPSSMTGVERDTRDCDRARRAVPDAQWTCGDIRDVHLPRAGTVVILDVLHYLDASAQESVLRRVRDALEPGGVLLVRVADGTPSWRLAATLAADRLATWLRAHASGPLHCRPIAQWRALLESLGFRVEERPMSAGTPFGNVMLVARG